ncbi:uncharacterized protein LOC130256646 isoform X2 [Oenanthe melanoleuca]|uniref:uncharacterized protein LOC130256646 isoform X2 n=1 Tax=Oenanthe melanoleuca TaxID=2939378 RepID=UPI0024C10420|nr:uncharacterized protein LOC130256646 isoform X2 [Oenanthe melanoleuca]
MSLLGVKEPGHSGKLLCDLHHTCATADLDPLDLEMRLGSGSGSKNHSELQGQSCELSPKDLQPLELQEQLKESSRGAQPSPAAWIHLEVTALEWHKEASSRAQDPLLLHSEWRNYTDLNSSKGMMQLLIMNGTENNSDPKQEKPGSGGAITAIREGFSELEKDHVEPRPSSDSGGEGTAPFFLCGKKVSEKTSVK